MRIFTHKTFCHAYICLCMRVCMQGRPYPSFFRSLISWMPVVLLFSFYTDTLLFSLFLSSTRKLTYVFACCSFLCTARVNQLFYAVHLILIWSIVKKKKKKKEKKRKFIYRDCQYLQFA